MNTNLENQDLANNNLENNNSDKSHNQSDNILHSNHAKYTPAHIANYFLKMFFENHIPITPIKLQKLIYIAYGWNLAFNNNKLFDEPIQAWKHGPVIPSIYYYYRRLNEIPENYFVGTPEIPENYFVAIFDETDDSLHAAQIVPESDKDTTKILKLVFANYKDKKPWDLVTITHKKDSPWDKVYNKDGVPESGKNLPLNDEDIKARSIEKILQIYPEANQTNDLQSQ